MCVCQSFVQALSQRVQTSATRVLTAVEWPPAEPTANADSAKPTATAENGGSADDDTGSDNPGMKTADDHADGNRNSDRAETPSSHRPRNSRSTPSSAESGGEGETLPKWVSQLVVFRFAAQDWAEEFWQVLNIQSQVSGIVHSTAPFLCKQGIMCSYSLVATQIRLPRFRLCSLCQQFVSSC